MKSIMEIILKDRDRKGISEAVEVLKTKFPVEKIVLFGSKAKGTDDEESDIDLLVLTRQPLSWQERNALTDALFDIELKHEIVISTLVVPLNEWKNGYWLALPIHDDIEKHGVAA